MLGVGFENLKPYLPSRSYCLFRLLLNLCSLSYLLLVSCLLLDGVLSLWKHKPKSHCSWSGFLSKQQKSKILRNGQKIIKKFYENRNLLVTSSVLSSLQK